LCLVPLHFPLFFFWVWVLHALCHLWPRGRSPDSHFDPCDFLNPKTTDAILDPPVSVPYILI
jgi:hypothetical protein